MIISNNTFYATHNFNIFVPIKDIFLKEILEKCPFLRVAMSQVPCLHEHLANAATASCYTASVMVE